MAQFGNHGVFIWLLAVFRQAETQQRSSIRKCTYGGFLAISQEAYGYVAFTLQILAYSWYNNYGRKMFASGYIK